MVVEKSREPDLSFQHWSMLKSIQAPQIPADVCKLILDILIILNLPKCEAHVPLAIGCLRTFTYDRQRYLDYVVKYFNHGYFSPLALKKFDKGEYAYVIENAKATKLANFLPYDKSIGSERRVILAAIREGGCYALSYASQELKNDREIVLTAIAYDGKALRYASQKLQSARDIVLAAVQKDGQALQYASQDLQGDLEIVLAATQENK